jgi:hypothetical protein
MFVTRRPAACKRNGGNTKPDLDEPLRQNPKRQVPEHGNTSEITTEFNQIDMNFMVKNA